MWPVPPAPRCLVMFIRTAFYNAGIAEANMMNIAWTSRLRQDSLRLYLQLLGLLCELGISSGLPSPIRLNVKVGAGNGGLSTKLRRSDSPQPLRHRGVRSMPNMTVWSSPIRTRPRRPSRWSPPTTDLCICGLSPTEVPYVLPEDAPFVLGKGNLLRKGSDLDPGRGRGASSPHNGGGRAAG